MAKPETRRRARVRRRLLHAAGCTYQGDRYCSPCIWVECIPELLEEAREMGVRVPRSLRAFDRGSLVAHRVPLDQEGAMK